jgi:SAM-dependent methyltransferase
MLRKRLISAPAGLFPEAFSEANLAKNKINLCVATNITSSYSAEHQPAIIAAAALFDEVIIDLGRFGRPRDSQAERDELFGMLTQAALEPVERLFFNEPYEYWRFRGAGAKGANKIVLPPAAAVPLATVPVPRRPLDAAAPTAPAPRSDRRGPLFSVFGDRQLADCPVCHSFDIAPLWRMPMTNLAEPINVFGGYFNQIPTLRVPATVFCFDFCRSCESIFLNPVDGRQKEAYRTTRHYIHKMQNASEWRGYEDVYDTFSPWIPQDAAVMIDAACGVGQYLQVARRRGTRQWQRLIGLELAESYVEHMRDEGLEAYAFDIDNDDLAAIVARDSVDFISFCEAFEHVERPLDALRKLAAVLRPGGRLYFTAQRYGTDVTAAVRPGEPIYIGEKLIDELPQRVGCRVVSIATTGMRYSIVLEK